MFELRFFSVYDIINYYARKNEISIQDVEKYFKQFGIKRNDLLKLNENGVIPSNQDFIKAITSFTGLGKIELELVLGRIPFGYENAFIKEVKQISKILLDSENNILDNNAANIEPFFVSGLGRLFKGDVIELFPLIDDNSVDCVFADPPFNLNKEYDEGVNDKKTFSEYISWCYDWLDECVRVLKPGGSLFIYNLPKWHTYLSDYLNGKMNFCNWITVDMKFSLPIPNKLYPSHYSLLYYSKGTKPNVFNPQRIPLQTCRHCGGETKDYGGYKSKMNPEGVNVSDVWNDIYPVRHKNSKNRKFNELPVKLLDRIISMSTNENDIVLDPFGGSGTTFAVAELLKRRWIGFELGNCDIIKERLLDKSNDKALLKKVYEEKNKLFPEKVKALRVKNGFWISEDINGSSNETKTIEQLKLI